MKTPRSPLNDPKIELQNVLRSGRCGGVRDFVTDYKCKPAWKENHTRLHSKTRTGLHFGERQCDNTDATPLTA